MWFLRLAYNCSIAVCAVGIIATLLLMIYSPLRDDEVLPVRKHRQVAMAPPEEDEDQEVSRLPYEQNKSTNRYV